MISGLHLRGSRIGVELRATKLVLLCDGRSVDTTFQDAIAGPSLVFSKRYRQRCGICPGQHGTQPNGLIAGMHETAGQARQEMALFVGAPGYFLLFYCLFLFSIIRLSLLLNSAVLQENFPQKNIPFSVKFYFLNGKSIGEANAQKINV